LVTPPDTAGGQPPLRSWLDTTAHPLVSLTSTDFSDLQFFKDVIGERRIVQLGESGHGVAEFNEAKVRLIRFFHEEMGFDVIAFESDLYACYQADRGADTLTTLMFMYSCPYGVWHTEEVLPLFDYIQQTRETDRPLILAGFDMKPSSWIAQQTRAAFMASVVEKVDSVYAKEVYTLETELNALFDESDWRGHVALRQAELRDRYTELHAFLVEHEGGLLAEYAEDPATPLVAQQTAAYTTHMVDFAVASQQTGCGSTEARDLSMAENATFLANRVFPERKILIWAHNFHIRHRNQRIAGSGCYTMGDGLVSRHRSELYTIGLYMGSGRAAWNNREVYTIAQPAQGSLEGNLSDAGVPFLFLDLFHQTLGVAPEWVFNPIRVRSWGKYFETLAPSEQYDGLLYVEQVRPPAYTN
jgi:erythromycin esterase